MVIKNERILGEFGLMTHFFEFLLLNLTFFDIFNNRNTYKGKMLTEGITETANNELLI